MYLFPLSLHQHGTCPCINTTGARAHVCVCAWQSYKSQDIQFNLETVAPEEQIVQARFFKLLQSELKQL